MHADNKTTGNIFVARLAAWQTLWTIVVAALWIAGMAWLPVDQDYSSGELLDHLLEWMGGGNLYSNPQQPPYRVFNYTPLGLLVARALGETGISALVAGRIVGTTGVLVAVWVVYGWMREMGVGRTAARATVALAGLSFPLLYSMGQFHLEGFAIALSLGSARLLWRGTGSMNGDAKATRFNCVAGGALAAMACFVKQTQVLSLAVLLVWLLVHHRKRLLPFAGAALFMGIIGAAMMQAWFGAEAWRHVIVYTVGTYSLDNLAFQLVSHALPWLPFAVAAWYHTFQRDTAHQSLVNWYLVGSSLLLLTSARIGSGFQYFLEWQLVVLLLFASALQQWMDSPRIRSARLVAAAGALVVVMNLIVDSVMLHNWQSARNTGVAFNTLCALAPQAPLLTPTEHAGAARACGARTALHPFIIANLTERGLWDERIFVEDLISGRYPALILPFNPSVRVTGAHRERWSPSVLAAMREAYHPLQVERGWWLMVPVVRTPSNSVDR